VATTTVAAAVAAVTMTAAAATTATMVWLLLLLNMLVSSICLYHFTPLVPFNPDRLSLYLALAVYVHLIPFSSLFLLDKILTWD
jgi:hypothetical protein